jgi:hypothetical protein
VNDVSAAWIRNDVGDTTVVYDNKHNPVCMSANIAVSDPQGTCYIEGLDVGNAFGSQWDAPNRNIRVKWSFTDTLTKTIKNNTITVGEDIYHQWANTIALYAAPPWIGFYGYQGNTGVPMADVLLEEVSSYNQGGI